MTYFEDKYLKAWILSLHLNASNTAYYGSCVYCRYIIKYFCALFFSLANGNIDRAYLTTLFWGLIKLKKSKIVNLLFHPKH